jgi:hypothetical protein
VAMGVLRQYLVDNFGLTAARAVLTPFGFAHGWRMAAAMQTTSSAGACSTPRGGPSPTSPSGSYSSWDSSRCSIACGHRQVGLRMRVAGRR